VINLWFWTFLAAAPFGMAVYQQADDPGWRFPLVAVTVAAFGFSYLMFGFPAEMFQSPAAYERHPDVLKFRAVIWLTVAASVCALGALVGRLFRSRANPVRLGVSAFLVAFFGLHLTVLYGESL
jgi:hypothetical protein